MKKLFTITAIAFAFTFTINAQEATSKILVSKKGTPILPQKGDFGIGVDAEPFLTYIGNIFGKTVSNDAPDFTSNGNNMTITGKYFIKNNTALRGSIRVGVLSSKEIIYVRDDIAYKTDYSTKDQVPDTDNYTESSISLGFGIEKRRGYGRLQGVYGFMGTLGFGSAKHVYEHGNEITRSNTNPTRSNYSNEIKMGSTFGVGAGVFVGVEYFIAPKLSIGGEFMYSLYYNNTGDSVANYDYWDSTSNGVGYVENEEIKSGGGSEFSLDNLATSSISLNFYF